MDAAIAATPEAPPSVDDAIARLAALEAEDAAAFRPPRSKRSLVIFGALVAAAAIAVVMWRHRPAPAAPTASAAVAPSPAPAAPAQPEAPAAAEAPIAAAPAATETPIARAPTTTTPEVATRQPSAPEAEPETPAKSSSHSASSRSSKKAGASDKHHAAHEAVEPAPAPEPKPVAPAGKTGDAVRAKLLGDQAGDMMIRGDFAAAARAYQQAIGADSAYAPAWRGRGLALERMGKARDAASAFRQFLKLEPNGANADKIRDRLKALDASP